LGATAFLHPTGRAATPPGGTITDTAPSASWQGQFYTLAFTADPAQCPGAADTLNLVCDHFYLNINLPGTFWQTHTGSVLITIQWTSNSNDFDLYIYRQSDGQQVGSSASGGTTSEQVALQNPMPGVYEVRAVPFLVVSSGYTGSALLAFTTGGPTPNPSFPTGGISFGAHTIVDPQRTEGEPLVHIDQAGNIWETGPWGFSTAQGFVARSTDNGNSFHIVSPTGLRPNPAPGGGGDTDIITDDQGNAYFADLEGLADIGVAVSNDQGNNWRENFVAAMFPVDDRQWLAIDNGPTAGVSDNTNGGAMSPISPSPACGARCQTPRWASCGSSNSSPTDSTGAARRPRARSARAATTGPVALRALYFRSEQPPNPSSRVTLGDRVDALGVPEALLDWRVESAERTSIEAWLARLDSAVRRSGIGRVIMPEPGWPEFITGGPHHMGTTRMSADPASGVVDRNCRVHSVGNLYVAGSSVFATGGYANPTFTLLALALRVADEVHTTLT